MYAFAVFGYITATLASFFIGRDQRSAAPTGADEAAGLRAELAALRTELAALRAELALAPPR